MLQTGVNTADAATVRYGGYAWRVIGYDGEGAAVSLVTNGKRKRSF